MTLRRIHEKALYVARTVEQEEEEEELDKKEAEEEEEEEKKEERRLGTSVSSRPV